MIRHFSESFMMDGWLIYLFTVRIQRIVISSASTECQDAKLAYLQIVRAYSELPRLFHERSSIRLWLIYHMGVYLHRDITLQP